MDVRAADGVRLVAMARSGEIFIARDNATGTLWLVSPPGAGGPERVDGSVVDRAVAQHGFDRVDLDFPGWAELDAERQRRAGLVTPGVVVDVERFDVEDVRRMLGVARRWQDAGQVPRAQRLVARLLSAPVALRDVGLHRELVALLDELVTAAPELPDRPPPSTDDPVKSAGRARVRLAQPA